MIAFRIKNTDIKSNIFIPKYYDPHLDFELHDLSQNSNLIRIGECIQDGFIEVSTGDEIGKMAYGTGDIPFVRTSDISNWEIKTIPKQGVSVGIYESYNSNQDVRDKDILLVRDGTYLIGTNCFVTELDLPMLYQSHILKLRVLDEKKINPYLLFLALNTSLVQKQIRSIQFTADIIDTIGNRFFDLVLPIPKGEKRKAELVEHVQSLLEIRAKYKAVIKQFPLLIENALATGSTQAFDAFLEKSVVEMKKGLVQDTITLEFGDFTCFKISSNEIKNNIFIPKYYDPSIDGELNNLKDTCDLICFSELLKTGKVSISTGDEIGKLAYGTGDIPFVRTSDFSNWEIKHDAKQGVSEAIYQQYADKEDVKANDILLVRDGTYLVGSSCIITNHDQKILFCGGLYKIRTEDASYLPPYLLLALLNSYIVKRQFRTKQFTRDVIDTLGKRIEEVILPIPKEPSVRKSISEKVEYIVTKRINARVELKHLSSNMFI